MTYLHRRQLLGLFGKTSLLAFAPLPLLAAAQNQKTNLGRLVIIGGAEDRKQDRIILRKFLELSGGPNAKIRVITAASGAPDVVWASYQAVFQDLGALNCELVPMLTRDDASKPDVVSLLAEADGIFITGGDQNRLMQCLWESPAAQAMHRAFHLNGCCIAGTSAGAAVMSRHMLAEGAPTPSPQKDVVITDIGMSFLPNAIVDQHFSQRHRLSRLLSALAQRPDLLGVGIDEDTALVIEPNQSIEVVGRGAVTLVDPRRMHSNFDSAEDGDQLEMLGLQLHLLPANSRYVLPANPKTRKPPVPFWDALGVLAKTGAMRG
jgi:cyanophycinase